MGSGPRVVKNVPDKIIERFLRKTRNKGVYYR